ncbi:hypothetical protein EMCG_02500 [[Emmonsia] crescens]|uniref:Uncharacterized protein n=1 Tax=[Emmonsia] crescens TaxID=73230 RepID=A0A0G2HYD3_9EURO|nr:hypothetical protein EMCG_02500 [Emmonsia crescens UAMH 3008]
MPIPRAGYKKKTRDIFLDRKGRRKEGSLWKVKASPVSPTNSLNYSGSRAVYKDAIPVHSVHHQWDSDPHKNDDPNNEEPRKEDPKKEEPKKEEPKKEEPKHDDPWDQDPDHHNTGPGGTDHWPGEEGGGRRGPGGGHVDPF